MSLAAATREAVRRSPHLVEALRAGVVNYAAAARKIGVGGDTDAVAAALRRMADQLPPLELQPADARVTMRSGVILGSEDDEQLLSVGETACSAGGGPFTGVIARGKVDAAALDHALGVCRTNGVEVVAAGVVDGELIVVVERRDGPDALRLVETALGAVPR